MQARRRPLTENVGGRQALLQGVETHFWEDFRYRSLTTSWPIFVVGAAVAFLALNAVFALAYFLGQYLGDDPVANVPGSSFAHYLYFSIETIATVGYGDMHPQSHYGHVIASLEMFVGLFYAAVLTGLIFARFARPRARVLFADRIAIGTHQGSQTLMLRMANERRNAITNASAKLWVILAADEDGHHFRAITELNLLRRETPVFSLSWTIFHRIDEMSPLYGLSGDDLAGLSAAFVVIIDGFDESSAQMIRARREYVAGELRFGERYVDILESTQEGLILDYGKFHHTEPQAPMLPAAET